jgi:hypothetical protein
VLFPVTGEIIIVDLAGVRCPEFITGAIVVVALGYKG